MQASLVTLACPNCGGDLELTSRPDLFKCAHCGKLALLYWPQAGAPKTAKVEAKQSWKANLLRPGSSVNWQGGELQLTATELVFVPHGLNFGPVEHAVLPLGSITAKALTKGLLSDDLMLTDASGQQWGVRVRNGAEVEQALEAATSV